MRLITLRCVRRGLYLVPKFQPFCVAGLATNCPVKEKSVTKKVDIRDPPTARYMARGSRCATADSQCRELHLANPRQVSHVKRFSSVYNGRGDQIGALWRRHAVQRPQTSWSEE